MELVITGPNYLTGRLILEVYPPRHSTINHYPFIKMRFRRHRDESESRGEEPGTGLVGLRYRAVYVPASSSVLTMSVATRLGGENKRYFPLLTS